MGKRYLKELKQERSGNGNFKGLLEKLEKDDLITPFQERQEGVVTYFHPQRGFGFIGHKRYFHVTEVKSGQLLKPGCRVRYTPSRSFSGKHQAIGVEPI